MTIETRVARSGWLWRAVSALLLGAMLVPAFGSHAALAWWNDEWAQRKKITVDMSAAGGNIAEPVGANVPILVRLHAGNFRFDAAKEDGSDIRFIAGDDKTPLKFAIEKFDTLLNEALVWVAVPDLKPGASNQVWLYYGNKKAVAGADAKGVYDSDTLLVYHFADRGSPPVDVTTWANHASGPGSLANGALIGTGLRLDGTTIVPVPGNPSLALADNGPLTFSVWFNMAAASPRGVIFSRREGAAGFVVGVDNGVPFVEVTNAGGVQRTAPSTPVAPAGWHHLAVVADGSQVVLYLDGAPYGTLAGGLPALSSPSTIGAEAPVALPRPADGSAADLAVPAVTEMPAAPAASNGFLGDIDEMQISKSARSPGFIRFAAIGQGTTPSKLISYAVDEQGGSWFDLGYFGIILKSVTLDGWVVIALLAVMAVVSWYVMYNKVSYLGRQSKANERFLKEFRRQADDLTEIDQGDVEEEDEDEVLTLSTQGDGLHKSVASHSSLYRIYHIGATDIERRLARGKGKFGFSEPAVAVIRAALDTQFIKETQKLNRHMVVLTIAISGGPFLGLLGTVVGVMITFAAIAATGDVNINAIAPGIAAALVATVAGLAVAIPALFAYNYFIIRITDLTSDMQAFIDEFVTRIAEAYQPRYTGSQREAAE